jgi:hypothetical protein
MAGTCAKCGGAAARPLYCPGCHGSEVYCGKDCFAEAWPEHRKRCARLPKEWRVRFIAQVPGETIFTEAGRLGYVPVCVSSPADDPESLVVKEWVLTLRHPHVRAGHEGPASLNPKEMRPLPPPGDLGVYNVDHSMFAQMLSYLAQDGNRAIMDRFAFGLVVPWRQVSDMLIFGGEVLERVFLAPPKVFLTLGLFTRNSGRCLFGPDKRSRYLGLGQKGPCRLTKDEWVEESIKFIADDARNETDEEPMCAIARIAGHLRDPEKWVMYTSIEAVLTDCGKSVEVTVED